MTSSTLELFDRCRRLSRWSHDYQQLRISPLRALYSALSAGLTAPTDGEKVAESHIIELAANPGLDADGADLYALAVHYSKLAAILTTYLRGSEPPWTPTPPDGNWNSSTYSTDNQLRRLILLDHWTDQRKMSEIRSWRTVAETSIYNRPILLNFLSIGSTSDGRRISPWSRTLSHPRSKQIRFAKKSHKIDGFAESWLPTWRENWEGSTLDWLAAMQSDGVFAELVHSVRVPVSPRRDEILRDIKRIEREIITLPANPPMTRSACYGFSPCTFVDVCHAPKMSTPADFGWFASADLEKSAQPA